MVPPSSSRGRDAIRPGTRSAHVTNFYSAKSSPSVAVESRGHPEALTWPHCGRSPADRIADSFGRSSQQCRQAPQRPQSGGLPKAEGT